MDHTEISKTFVRPTRDLRNNYAELRDIIEKNNHIIITNQGKGEAVLIGIEQYVEYEKYLYQKYIVEELSKAKIEAIDPSTKWLSHDDVWSKLEIKYGI